MTNSSFELYGRGEIGKLNLHWQGMEVGSESVLDSIIANLDSIKRLVIVVDSSPHSLATCLRMVALLTRQLDRLKINSQVVFENQEIIEAIEITGFDHLFTTWNNEQAAAQAMGITQFYPLELIRIFSSPLEPLAA